jgi:predicted ATPase
LSVSSKSTRRRVLEGTEAPVARASGPLRFTRLRLENWRNFTKIEVKLQRRVFLVGPNASGKSNLLDSLRFLHDVATVGGGLQEAVRKRGGVSLVRSLAARQNPDVVIDVDVGTNGAAPKWRYELRFTRGPKKRPLLKSEVVYREGELLLNRPDEFDLSDPERRTQTALEQVNLNRDFREVSEFFGRLRYLHIVPQLVREPDRSVGKINDPFGGDFLEQVARTPKKTREARLKRIQEALKVAVPQLVDLKLEQDERGLWHLYGRYEHWRPHGAWQSEGQFSDGTLRLLGVLWAVQDGSGPLLLEEPELSLHPEVVRFLPQMFARIQRRTGRQIVLSTHSPDLLSDSGIGLDEVLLLRPRREGTVVEPATKHREIPSLLRNGSSIADAVLPKTRPEQASQLALFGR